MKYSEDFIDGLSYSKEYCPTLARYGRNLTLLAATGNLSQCYAREKELEDMRIAMRRLTKPNILLTGPSGCGKTALVEGLAQMLVDELYVRYNDSKNDSTVIELFSQELPMIYELSAGDILAGSKYRGDFEERLQKILEEMKKHHRKVVMFIDEAHLLATLGDAEGAISAANLLKPALARGEIIVIAATTDDEYKRYLSKDKALLRRFTRVGVKPIPEEKRPEAAMAILTDYKKRFQIEVAAEINCEYITSVLTGPLASKQFPCDFVDTVDTMFAKAAYKKKTEITKADVGAAVYLNSGCFIV